MSQVDILNYWPLLCWFIIFFGACYGLIFCYVVPLIFQYLKIQSLFIEYKLEKFDAYQSMSWFLFSLKRMKFSLPLNFLFKFIDSFRLVHCGIYVD